MEDYVELKMDRCPIRIYADKMYIGTHTVSREVLLEWLKIQEELQPLTIEFQWDVYEEEDDVWDALWVKINGGKWRMAQPIFGMEDEKLIRQTIESNPKGWKEIIK